MRYACGMEQSADSSLPPPSKKVPGRWLYWAGGGVSLVYLGAFGFYGLSRWAKIWTMEPNNLGDFLAGAFAPLAFLWLVLGFIQQGIELRQNSAALLLQAEELRSAARHAGDMVDVARKDFDLRLQGLEDQRAREAQERVEFEARRSAELDMKRIAKEKADRKRLQPDFDFRMSMADKQLDGSVMALLNDGADVTDVHIRFLNVDVGITLVGPSHFENFESKLQEDVGFSFWTPSPVVQRFDISFKDMTGSAGSQSFVARLANSRLEIERNHKKDSN